MDHATGTQSDPAGATDVIGSLLRFTQPEGALLNEVLHTQCRLSGADAGAIVKPGHEPQVRVLALHPPEAPTPHPESADAPAASQSSSEPPAWLAAALNLLPTLGPIAGPMLRSFREETGLYGQPASRHVIFLPMRGDGAVYLGLFLIATTNPAVVEDCLQRLAGTEPLLTLFDTRRVAKEKLAGVEALRAGMAVLSAVNEQGRFKAAAMALCNEVHAKWSAERVSLGIVTGHTAVKLRAMSHTEHLNRKMQVVQDIEAAMEECLDQEVEVAYPGNESDAVVARSAERLSQQHGPTRVVSVPLWRGGEVVGVLTVERDASRPASPPEINASEAEGLRLACNLVAPGIIKLYESDRWVGAKLAAQTRKSASTLIGPEHTWWKLGAVAGCLLLVFLIFFRGADRVSAPFVIDAPLRQVVSAPFDGYLSAVHVEPGDDVAGTDADTTPPTVLAALETAELELRAAQLRADRLHHEKQVALSLREGKIVEAQIAEADAAKVTAELDLIEYQIAHAAIVSPRSGMVLEGDHVQRIGGTVAKGDVLFEIVPTDDLEAILMVPEQRATELAVGDEGEFASAAHPGQYIPFVIEHIEPMAQVMDGQNVFRVKARFDASLDDIRPGMEGVAKVEVGRSSYLWLWTRDAIHWLRMKLWL